MKLKIITFLAVLCSLLCLSIACSRPTEAGNGEAPAQDTATRITNLEKALQQEREERRTAENAYAERLTALQQRLDRLEQTEDTSVGAPAEDGELIFSYRVEGERAVITAFLGSARLVTVPATLEGYPVAAIGERAFEGKDVVAVILPDGLETIGWFAFYGCESLISITVPPSVASIGYGVFDGCTYVSLVCEGNSYAAQYADSYGLPHVSP